MMKLMQLSTQLTSPRGVGATGRPSASPGQDTAFWGRPGAAAAEHTRAHAADARQNGRRPLMRASPSHRQSAAS